MWLLAAKRSHLVPGFALYDDYPMVDVAFLHHGSFVLAKKEASVLKLKELLGICTGQGCLRPYDCPSDPWPAEHDPALYFRSFALAVSNGPSWSKPKVQELCIFASQVLDAWKPRTTDCLAAIKPLFFFTDASFEGETATVVLDVVSGIRHMLGGQWQGSRIFARGMAGFEKLADHHPG